MGSSIPGRASCRPARRNGKTGIKIWTGRLRSPVGDYLVTVWHRPGHLFPPVGNSFQVSKLANGGDGGTNSASPPARNSAVILLLESVSRTQMSARVEPEDRSLELLRVLVLGSRGGQNPGRILGALLECPRNAFEVAKELGLNYGT